jgi:hypothetical protein
MTFDEIKAKFYQLTKTNSGYPIADLVINANAAYAHAVGIIRRSDRRAKWDDLNQENLPIAVTGLVEGQQDYELANEHLGIQRVEIKGADGRWRVLKPFDEADIPDTSLEDISLTPGIPTHFDWLGQSVFLYPPPNYSLDEALEAYHTRGPVYFTESDTTKEPGFNSLYHEIIPYYMAHDYCLINLPELVPGYERKLLRLEQALAKDYAYRGPGRPRFYAKQNTAI